MHYLCSLALFVLVAIVSCKSDGETVQQKDIIALEKEVLKIHDEVMPKMSDIARLMEILDAEAKNTSIDSMLRLDVIRSMAELDAGDSLMWEWMHNYKKPEDAPLDSIHAYLLSEKARVAKVRDVMLEGIKNAESLAQKLGHVQPN